MSLVCPPVSRVCLDPERPPVDLPGGRSSDDLYGTPGDADDAFWFGYYTALEALSEADTDDDG